MQMPALVEEVLEEEEDEDPCSGKRCTANEHCCDGHVCVDTEDESNDVCEYLYLVYSKKLEWLSIILQKRKETPRGCTT